MSHGILPFFSFSKMQALGNDFVVIDLRLPENVELGDYLLRDRRAAAWICDRRWGIGADQLLTISQDAQSGAVRMDVWNTDGSRAEMCGNGIRAVALKTGAREIETLAGKKLVEHLEGRWRVAMGRPQSSGASEHLEWGGGGLEFIPVSMGNPHAVIFVEDVQRLGVAEFADIGRAVEFHKRFAPERTNVEFVQVLSPSRLLVRVWERGVGATLACGTGACAATVAAILSGRINQGVSVEVVLPGGSLTVEWPALDSDVLLSGPASLVYEGRWSATDPYWKAD